MNKMRKNVPVLRFPEFEGEWDLKKLGEVAESIVSGKTKQIDKGIYNVYGSTSIIGSFGEYTHDGRSILIARVGANAGTINLVNGKFCVTDNTLVRESGKSINIIFVFFLLSHLNLNKFIFGSGQPLITGGQLKVLKCKFPTTPEQQKIADFLSSIDKKIELVNTQIEKTKTWKRGLLQQMFV